MPNTNSAQLSEGLFNPNTGLGLESRVAEIEIIIDSFKDNANDGEILYKVDDETIDGVSNPTAAELKTQFDNFDAITDGHVVYKNGANDPKGIPKTQYGMAGATGWDTTALVERIAGVISTEQIRLHSSRWYDALNGLDPEAGNFHQIRRVVAVGGGDFYQYWDNVGSAVSPATILTDQSTSHTDLRSWYTSFNAKTDTPAGTYVLTKTGSGSFGEKKWSSGTSGGYGTTDSDLVERQAGVIYCKQIDLGNSFPLNKIALWGGLGASGLYGFSINAASLNYDVNNNQAAHRFWTNGNNGTGTELLRVGATTLNSLVGGVAVQTLGDLQVGIELAGTGNKLLKIWGDDVGGSGTRYYASLINDIGSANRAFNFPDVGGTLRVGSSVYDQFDLTDGTTTQVIAGHGTTAPVVKIEGALCITSTLTANSPSTGDGTISIGMRGYFSVGDGQVLLRTNSTTVGGIVHTSLPTVSTICSRDASGYTNAIRYSAGTAAGTPHIFASINVYNAPTTYGVLIATESAQSSGFLTFSTDVEGGTYKDWNIDSQYTLDNLRFLYTNSSVSQFEVFHVKATGDMRLHGQLSFDNTIAGAAGTYSTSVVATNPTADRTITLPDATGTVALEGSTSLADLITWYNSFVAITNDRIVYKTASNLFGMTGILTPENIASSVCMRNGTGGSNFRDLFLSDSTGGTTQDFSAFISQLASDTSVAASYQLDPIIFRGRYERGYTAPLDDFGNIVLSVPKAIGGNPFNASNDCDSVISFQSGSGLVAGQHPMMGGICDADRYTYVGAYGTDSLVVDNKGSNFTTNSVSAGYDKDKAFYQGVPEDAFLQQEGLPVLQYHGYKSNFTYCKNLVAGTPQMNSTGTKGGGGSGRGATRIQDSAIFGSIKLHSGMAGAGINQIIMFDTNYSGFAAYEAGYTYDYSIIKKYSAALPTGGVDRDITTVMLAKQVKFGEAGNYATIHVDYSHYTAGAGFVAYRLAVYGYNPITNAGQWQAVGDQWERYYSAGFIFETASWTMRIIIPSNCEYITHFCLMANSAGGTGLTAPVSNSPATTAYTNWGDYFAMRLTNAPYYEIAS